MQFFPLKMINNLIVDRIGGSTFINQMLSKSSSDQQVYYFNYFSFFLSSTLLRRRLQNAFTHINLLPLEYKANFFFVLRINDLSDFAYINYKLSSYDY